MISAISYSCLSCVTSVKVLSDKSVVRFQDIDKPFGLLNKRIYNYYF